MSGHSKWSTIKHKKAITDAKRANIFTKLAKDVTIAARDGGDPEMNFKLRMAMDRAKNSNMPKENIERAIKRGTGELKDAAQIEELVYEGYGPGNIAILISVATDNKNRTLSEVRNILNKNGGKMVEGGSVSWQFEQVGRIELGKNEKPEEELEMQIIESGAKDYKKENDAYIIFTQPNKLQEVKECLDKEGMEIVDCSLSYVAKDVMSVDEKKQEAYHKLLDALDEQDDVTEVYDNLE